MMDGVYMAAKKMPKIDTDADVTVLEDQDIEEPKLYVIILHNDDFTTQDFVVYVLVNFLHKSPKDAFELMMKVHLEGKARVGQYVKDIAETKVHVITAHSRKHGMPLLVTCEPA